VLYKINTEVGGKFVPGVLATFACSRTGHEVLCNVECQSVYDKHEN